MICSRAISELQSVVLWMCGNEDVQEQARRSKNLTTCRKEKLEKNVKKKQRIWGRKKYGKLA
jgi:hypothetical protein